MFQDCTLALEEPPLQIWPTHFLQVDGFNFLVTFAISWLFHIDDVSILLSKRSNSNWFCRPVYKLLLQIEDPLSVRWFISIFVEQPLTTSIVVIIFMLKGVSGRLDDNYLVHKLEQGCLLHLENCHIKEEVVIIIAIIISRRSSTFIIKRIPEFILRITLLI